LGLLPEEASDLILGAAIISIVLNPFVFMIVDRMTPKPAKSATDPLSAKDRAIIVGFGRVRSRVARSLGRLRIEYSVVEDRQEVVERLHEKGVPAIAGNAVSADVLEAAAVHRAHLIYVTVPDGFEAGRIVEIARRLNPKFGSSRVHHDERGDRVPDSQGRRRNCLRRGRNRAGDDRGDADSGVNAGSGWRSLTAC